MLLDGTVQPLEENDKNSIKSEVIEKYANDALRTVAISYREITGSIPENDEEVQSDLVLIAIVGIQDPVREGVPQVI